MYTYIKNFDWKGKYKFKENFTEQIFWHSEYFVKKHFNFVPKLMIFSPCTGSKKFAFRNQNFYFDENYFLIWMQKIKENFISLVNWSNNIVKTKKFNFYWNWNFLKSCFNLCCLTVIIIFYYYSWYLVFLIKKF